MGTDTIESSATTHITMQDAAELVRKLTGHRPSRSTLAEWAAGKRGAVLATWKLGRHRFTSQSAIMDFAAACAAPPPPPAIAPTVPAQRRAEIERAMSVCERHGVRPVSKAKTKR